MSQTNEVNAAQAFEAPASVENQNAVQTASNQPETIEGIVKRLCQDGHSHVVTTTITAIDCSEKAAKSGDSYINAFITVNNPLKAAVRMPDGSVRMGTLGGFQTPFNSLLLVMRKHAFYGRYVAYVEEAANLGGAFAGLYTAGTTIKVFCQFVAAGAQERNPFTRAENPYEIREYDRYIYHIVGIDAPTDPITVGAYAELNKRIAQDLQDAIKARRQAKAAAANILAQAAVPADEMPF